MTTMWGDCPKADLMDAWCEALGQIAPERVRAALEKVPSTYPEWPPTLGEFLVLCKSDSIPAAHRAFLPAPRDGWKVIDPRIKAEIDAMLEKGRKRDPKDWARKILSEADAGTHTLPYGIQCAKEALGLSAS
jgi:hypothetical protein